MDRKKFEELVLQAAEELPDEFKDRMDNVELVVEDLPSLHQIKRLRLRHPLQLLGLYEGIPQTSRSTNYSMVPPDKITLFQKSIEADCERSGKAEEKAIVDVLKHEIAHHFGISDEKLIEIERSRRKKKF